ncbi:MAG: hypothetical protein QOG15_89 [Solirubrobacteraceae bacterium]|nr:hypothetical protein [Solirubrobacteraceae bacterium]
MNGRKRYLPLILALGVGAGLLPSLAQGVAPPSTSSITAAAGPKWAGPDGTNTVYITPGGTVTFSNTTALTHNVAFTATQPQSCAEIAPDSGASVPPLPPTATAGPWSGTCTFANLGDYPFHCTFHTGMRGTVVVANELPPPTTSTGGGTTTGTPPPPPPPGIPPAANALKLKSTQKGKSVKGSINILLAGSKLDVRAVVKRKTLGISGSGRKRVGRYLRNSVAAKTVNFKVSLSAKAKKALKNKGKLKIRIDITVTPPIGSKYTKTKTVTLKP